MNFETKVLEIRGLPFKQLLSYHVYSADPFHVLTSFFRAIGDAASRLPHTNIVRNSILSFPPSRTLEISPFQASSNAAASFWSEEGEMESIGLTFHGKEDPHCLVNYYYDRGCFDVYSSSGFDIQSHSSSATASPSVFSCTLTPSQSPVFLTSPGF
jgi:hypothetical protein